MIIPLPLKKVHCSDAYLQSHTHIEARSNDGENKYYRMQRTGITAPGTPDRAVYAQNIGPSSLDIDKQYYVFEAGYFWPSKEWHQFYRETGQTPGEVEND